MSASFHCFDRNKVFFLQFHPFLVIMPRNYVRKTAGTPIDVPNLVAAIKSIKKDGQSVYSVAAIHKMYPKTLYRHLQRIDTQFPDFSKVTDAQLTEFFSSVSVGTKTVGSDFIIFFLCESVADSGFCSRFFLLNKRMPSRNIC